MQKKEVQGKKQMPEWKGQLAWKKSDMQAESPSVGSG